MSQVKDPATAAAHAIRLCRRGILCHGEMWALVLDRVPPTGECAFLDGLPPDAQEFLREAFAQQPESFASGVGLSTAPAAVTAEVKRWCRRSRV
jgi:hypothetical protein